MTARLQKLVRRGDYLRVAGARNAAARPGLVLQARPSPAGETALRVGFTASKKVGGAVVRNRARRRLKEAARIVMPSTALPGYDYVLIARGETPNRRWEDLLQDLQGALRRLRLLRPETALDGPQGYMGAHKGAD